MLNFEDLGPRHIAVCTQVVITPVTFLKLLRVGIRAGPGASATEINENVH